MAYRSHGDPAFVVPEARLEAFTDRVGGAEETAGYGGCPLAIGRSPNAGVWLTEKRAGFEVRPAPATPPGAHEIVVRNRAVAINPVDWITQPMGGIVTPWVKYPFILGSDVAGEVAAVGAAVSRFEVGDRVLGHAVGLDKQRNSSAEGGFQDYTVLLEHMAAPIPDDMAYESAAVLPLGLSTAACGLFQADQLALDHPSAQPRRRDRTVLIWGGSTSVGSNAIQLAVAAGYDVITTASPRNFDYVRRLGASAVFDYASRTVVADVIEAFKGRTCAGALAIGIGSAEACLDIVHGCKGAKVVAMTTPSVEFDTAPSDGPRLAWLIPTMARLIGVNVALMLKARSRGVRMKYIFGTSLMRNEVSRMIYTDFLPAALAEGRYVAAPDPLVVGRGLGHIPEALALLRKGVSARKLVVAL